MPSIGSLTVGCMKRGLSILKPVYRKLAVFADINRRSSGGSPPRILHQARTTCSQLPFVGKSTSKFDSCSVSN